MYLSKFPNRKLTWLYQHGTCEVHPTFTQKPFTLQVNVFQATVLDCFNQKQTWTYKELEDATKIPKIKLDAALLQLCKPKNNKLLVKQFNKPQFSNPDEELKVNTEWTHA